VEGGGEGREGTWRGKGGDVEGGVKGGGGGKGEGERGKAF
jgi:hypothetical protein